MVALDALPSFGGVNGKILAGTTSGGSLSLTMLDDDYKNLINGILSNARPKHAAESNVGALPGVYSEVSDLLSNSKPVPVETKERFVVAVKQDFGEQ